MDDLAARLRALAEELADAALDRLVQASEAVREGGDPDPALLAEERRLTRARRAVERAAALVEAGPDRADGGAD